MKDKLFIILILILIPTFVYAGGEFHKINALSGPALIVEGNASLAIIAGDTTSIDGKIPSDPATVTEQNQLQDLIGEVQASPTENTVLERLKVLETAMTDASQKTQIVDSNGHVATQDSMTNTRVGTNYEHHKIHTGASFERHIDSANATVATMNVAFKTAAGTKKAHMLFGFSSNDEIFFEICEGATWTQGTGTVLNVFNINRNTGDGGSTVILEDDTQPTPTANNQVLKDVTVTACTKQIENQYTYNAGLGAATTVESRTAGHEWILKPDETYLIRMTQTDGNCKMSINLHWYEHADVN